jgi:anti-sigma-K factor RskA
VNWRCNSAAIAASVIVSSAAAYALSNSAPTASPLSIAYVNQAETEAQPVRSANIEYVKETMTLSDAL